MPKIINSLVITFVLTVLLSFSTAAVYLEEEKIVGNSFSSGSSNPKTEIVLNEFMANPTGYDNALMPGGEWVELYNKGNWPINLTGWYLTDSGATHILNITVANSSTGTTIMPAHGYLVVYRNGDGDFELNNSGNDSVKLYSPAAVLVDSYDYVDLITENKTWGRIPNGIGVWTSGLTPSLGGPNV